MEKLNLNLDSNLINGNFVENIRNQATELANLIKDSQEFQELLRLGRLINLDPEVNRLIQAIRIKEQAYSLDSDSSLEELHRQLEALPAFENYLKAENAARDLFQTINQAITEAAGVEYASNAKRSSCSCGG